jgi:hypothetical protein
MRGKLICLCNSGVRNYFKHLLLNCKVAGRSVIMALFHFVHGIIPVKYTSHDSWGFSPRGKKEKLK